MGRFWKLAKLESTNSVAIQTAIHLHSDNRLQ